MKRVVSVYPTKTWKLLIEFTDADYRVYDAKKHLSGKFSPLGELAENIQLFLTAHVIPDAGTVGWENGADLDPDVLYEMSESSNQLNVI
jgi:hypothetical protein